MFSFLGIESKPVESKPAEPVVPSHDAGASSMFGGMAVQQQQGSGNDDAAVSSFNFINEEEQAPTQSAFSFLQEPANDQESSSQGFSFMSSEGETPQGAESSFSFMSSAPTTQDDFTATILPSPATGETYANAAGLETHNVISFSTTDIKLNKTPLNKQGAKKKKRATKVGFGRDEEEDGEDKSTQPNVVSPAILIDSSSVLDSAHTAVESERLPSAGTNAISAMDVLEKVQVTHDGYSTSEFNLEGMSISENNLSSRNFPSTPPPLPPTVAPATVVAAQLHSNVPAITDHPVNIDTRSMSSSQAISDLAPPQISAPTPEPARPSANACVPSPVHTHVAVPASVPSPVAAAVAAETPVQKLERKSKETLVQLTRYLADLSRLHSSALSGQGRFKPEIDTEESAMQAAAKRQEEAEEEQSRLAALEEFERADALNEVIHTCSAESEARQAVLRDLRASVRLLEETFAQERAECISNFHRACNSLRVTREQLGLALAQVQSSSSRQFEMEESRIRAELERIGLEKGHFQREEEALQGDAERTEEVIRAQTVDLSAKKGELEASIGVLDEEILLLQQQLAAKMAAQQQLSKELGQVDGKIGEVRKKYDRQLQRIADRQAALEQSKRECLQEESAVMLEQTSLQRQVQNSKECHSSAAQWAHALETDVTIAEALLSNLSPTRSASSADRCALASINRLEASSEDVSTQELRRNIDAINYLLSKKRALVVELQDQHDSLLTEARRVGELLPKLDAEKKAHAASKRFKEAAAVAKELKELQAAKDASDAEVERLSTLMDNTLVEVSALEEKHAASSKALRDAHRQHDVSRFEALLLRVQEVRALQKQVHKEVRKRKRVAGVGEEGARTGGEGGEGHSGPAELFEAAGRFFSSELLSCLSEAAAIKERHALPQELDHLDVDLSEGSDSDISDLEGVDANASGGETAVNNGGVSEDAENMSPMDLKGGGSVVAADVDEDLVLHEDAKHSTDIGREDCSGAEEEEEQAPVIVLTAARATSAPVESDSANGSVESSLASGGDSGGNSGGAAHRDTMMLQAQALLLSIEEINVRLEEATDYEDYEKAAELFEEATAAGEHLDQLVGELQTSKEDIRAYRSAV